MRALAVALLLAGCHPEYDVVGGCPFVLNELVSENGCDGPKAAIDTGVGWGGCDVKSPDWIEVFNRSDHEASFCHYALGTDISDVVWEFCSGSVELRDCDGDPLSIFRKPIPTTSARTTAPASNTIDHTLRFATGA